MKIRNRIIYTSLLVLGCVLFAWPNTSGAGCDGQVKASFLIHSKEEVEPEAELDIEPLINLLPSCNLIIR